MSDDQFDSHPTNMQQLTPAEIDAFNLAMSKWQTLPDVHRLMMEVNEKAQLYIVAQGALKSWRETFVAMSCGILTHATRLKLGDDPPDFELDYGDHQRSFELVDVLPKDWKIRGEYKNHAQDLNAGRGTSFRNLSHSQSEVEVDALDDDFEAQLNAKMKKNYPAETILVADIYHQVYFDSDTGSKRGLVRVAQKGLKVFREIWVRRHMSILRITKKGVSQISSPWPDSE